MHPLLFVEIPWMLLRRVMGFSALAIGMAGFLVGCTGGAPVPKLAQVSGTVKIKGEPAAGVQLTFTPIADTKTTGAVAHTGPDGTYKLMHRSGEPGIEPGKYGVTFSRLLADGKPIPPGTSPTELGATESLPESYQQVNQAFQKVEVPAKGATLDFNLDGAGK